MHIEAPIRVQRKRIGGWKMPPNTVYVGRPHALGNPFVVGKDGDAAECVNKYKAYMFPYTRQDGSLGDYLQSEFALSKVFELKGKNLACWCPLDQPCHADVLLRAANWDWRNNEN